MLELVDKTDSKSVVSNHVRVRVSLALPLNNNLNYFMQASILK